jgi:hypothetical protein
VHCATLYTLRDFYRFTWIIKGTVNQFMKKICLHAIYHSVGGSSDLWAKAVLNIDSNSRRNSIRLRKSTPHRVRWQSTKITPLVTNGTDILTPKNNAKTNIFRNLFRVNAAVMTMARSTLTIQTFKTCFNKLQPKLLSIHQ